MAKGVLVFCTALFLNFAICLIINAASQRPYNEVKGFVFFYFTVPAMSVVAGCLALLINHRIKPSHLKLVGIIPVCALAATVISFVLFEAICSEGL